MPGLHLAAQSAEATPVEGGDYLIVAVVAVVGLLALAVAGGLVREVLAASEGTDRMRTIAKAVQEGAAAYLGRQFRTGPEHQDHKTREVSQQGERRPQHGWR